MLATEEMVAEPLPVKVCWWVWTLCRDDRNGVDAKDLCPSPSKCCLDGFEFVDRVGLNRGGDALFARDILVHLPVPQEKPSRLARYSSNHRPQRRSGKKDLTPPWKASAECSLWIDSAQRV